MRGEFLVNGHEPHLQPNVGLDHTVVQVARNAPSLRFGSLRGQPVDQTDVIDSRHRMFEHLQEKIDIRSLKSIPPGGCEVEPSDGLTPIAYRHSDIRLRSQDVADLLYGLWQALAGHSIVGLHPHNCTKPSPGP